MRILTWCSLMVVASLLLVQTPQDLRNRYGEPDMERFMPRPGIGLTVQYGSDHIACQILIEPPQQLLHRDDEARFMSSEAVTDILEEVVPADTRGNQTFAGHIVSGCNEIELTEYQNVSITRATHNCLPLQPEREMRATVNFKRDICQSQSK